MTDMPGEAQLTEGALPRVTFAYSVLVLDVVMRWLVWAFCRPFPEHDLRLWLLQVLLVPLAVLSMASYREEKVRKRAGIKEYAGYVPPASMMRLSACAFAACLGSIMAWRHLGAISLPWLRITVEILATLGYMFYLGMLWPMRGDGDVTTH